MGSEEELTSEDQSLLRKRAHLLFERIQREFPGLEMNLEHASEHVELDMNIPIQAGIALEMNVNLQNEDELHLSAGTLWLQWFPCSDLVMEQEFFDAVVGLLCGRSRIVEHLQGRRAVRAELQKPVGEGWETIGTSTVPHLPLPWRKSHRVIQNSPKTLAKTTP